MSNDKRSKNTITLGSGKVFIDKYEDEIPSDEEIEVTSKLIGWISGGATIEYSPEFYSATDDLGKVKKTIITSETAKLKTGVMTWNGETLQQLCSTGRVTEADGIRTVKIGGISNNDNQSYVVHFLHEDKVDGDVRVTIVGKNTAGFSLAFAKDKETVVDAEFEAVPNDDDGTLIIYKEEITE